MSLEKRLERAVDKAFKALDDLAGPMIIQSVSNSQYDPSAGTLAKTEQSVTVEAVFDTYESDRVDGTLIQREDRLILVKPVDTYIPKIGDTITDPAGIVYNIMDFNEIKTYNKPFLWELQARK